VLVHFSLPSLRFLLAAATVYVHKITREQCAATDKDAVQAVGKEAEAAQAARQAAKGA
jgi:hypothetical protein